MANYAHIENGMITGVYDLIPENWRNISNFYVLCNSVTDSDSLTELGWRTIQKPEISYDPTTQKLADPTYIVEDDQVIEHRVVIEMFYPDTPQPDPYTPSYTDAELFTIKSARHERAMRTLREKRDGLLTSTDFTQLADVMITNGEELTAQYQVYRQRLRDLPKEYEDNIDFDEGSVVSYPGRPGV